MTVSMDLIKQLREETGAGITECKNALIESAGDIEKARKILLAKGAAKASKKLDRTTNEGIVFVKNNGSKGLILELACETDFVARNEKFINLAKNISDFLFDKKFSTLSEALEIEYEPSKTLQTFLNENISIFGENIKISRIDVLEVSNNNEYIFDYVHFNYRVGVLALIEFDKNVNENWELKKEIGTKTVFQIASMKPLYIDLSSIPNEEIEESKRIAFQQAVSEGKPEHIAQKIAEGKVNKMFEDSVLLEQVFYEESMNLPKFKDYLKFVSSKLNEKVNIKKFVRYQIGK